MSVLKRVILVLAIGLGPALCPAHDDGSREPGDSPQQPTPHKPGTEGKRRQARSLNGHYDIEFGGYYSGKGSANVSEDSLTLTVDVTLSDGTQVTLKAGNLAIDGPYFSGRARVGTEAITITGRLDAAKASRVSGTYSSTSGHRGRFAGSMPADQGDDRWIETNR